jgi:hypothetical protein
MEGLLLMDQSSSKYRLDGLTYKASNPISNLSSGIPEEGIAGRKG